jgi:hypothetical protein
VQKSGKRFVIPSLGAGSPVGSEGEASEDGVDSGAEGGGGASAGVGAGACAGVGAHWHTGAVVVTLAGVGVGVGAFAGVGAGACAGVGAHTGAAAAVVVVAVVVTLAGVGAGTGACTAVTVTVTVAARTTRWERRSVGHIRSSWFCPAPPLTWTPHVMLTTLRASLRMEGALRALKGPMLGTVLACFDPSQCRRRQS